MRKKWVVCMIACLMILLAGCNGNTAKENARNDTDKRISSTAGNTETTTERVYLQKKMQTFSKTNTVGEVLTLSLSVQVLMKTTTGKA